MSVRCDPKRKLEKVRESEREGESEKRRGSDSDGYGKVCGKSEKSAVIITSNAPYFITSENQLTRARENKFVVHCYRG